MIKEIQIQAEVLSEQACQFTVDEALYPAGTAYSANKEAAEGSPLAEALVGVEGVASLVVSGNVLKVTRSQFDDWRLLAQKIGTVIREQICLARAGAKGRESPLISPDLKKNLPSEKVIKEKVQKLFDEEINPAVAMHGGNVELVDVKENIVYVRLGGGCQGCGMADVTLKQGIEHAVRKVVPEVGDVLDVTDHAGGRNPYYSPQKK
jgi:Fe-S cluster biogenesis protein NfuA